MEQPLPADAGAWRIEAEYSLLGLFPQTAEALLFTNIGEEA